jgi:hypothetical protein
VGRSAAALILAAMLSSIPGLAAGPSVALGAPGGPNLTLQAPARSVVGQNVGATAVLTGRRGQPFGGVPVSLLVNGSQVARVFTNSQGAAAFTIPGSVLNAAGTYSLVAVSGGFFRNSSPTLSLVVTAAAPGISGGGGHGTVVVGTRLSLAIPTGSQLGQDVAVSAVLRDASGRPVAGQHLALMLDGVQLKSDASGPAGNVDFSIPGKKLGQARSYAIAATFSGSHGYAASSATATLDVGAAAIRILTVPPAPGLDFSLAGVTAVTGPDGVAALPVPASGIYKLSADLNPEPAGTLAARVSFVRWADSSSAASRTISVDGPASYVMGVRIAYAARVQYVDAAGRTIDPTIVDEADFKAADGTDVVLNPQTGNTKVWWTASTAAAPTAADAAAGLATPGANPGLAATPISYRAVSVKIHGADALAPGPQTWTPSDGGTWTIRLQLYDLTVRALDSMFGAPMGGKVDLTRPDGTKVAQSIGADGTARFSGLPAGAYRLGLEGQAGTMSLALAKTQDTTLRVVTITDGLVAIALGLIGLAIVLMAWRGLLRQRRRRVPTVA